MDVLYVNNNDEITRVNTVSALKVGTWATLPSSPFTTGGRGLAGAFIGAHTVAQFQNRCLFASNQGDNTISAFRIKPTGGLTSVGPPVSTGLILHSGSLAVATKVEGNFLYAGGVDGIRGFRILRDCSLQPVAGSGHVLVGIERLRPVCDLLVTPDNEFLVASMMFDREVRVFRIDRTGLLPSVPGSPFPVGAIEPTGLEFLQLSRQKGLLFVGHRFWNGAVATRPSTFAVSVHQMNLITGALSPVRGSPFTFSFRNLGSGSSCLRLSPNGKFLFVGNDLGRSVTVLKVAATGQLALRRQPVPVASNSPGTVLTAIERNSTGKLLFTANASLDVGAFEVDLASGTLTAVSGSPFPTNNTNVVVLQSGIVFVRI